MLEGWDLLVKGLHSYILAVKFGGLKKKCAACPTRTSQPEFDSDWGQIILEVTLQPFNLQTSNSKH